MARRRTNLTAIIDSILSLPLRVRVALEYTGDNPTKRRADHRAGRMGHHERSMVYACAVRTMPATNRVQTELLSALTAQTGSSPQPSDELSKLGIDSVEMAGLVSELERRFGIRVDEEVFDVVTVEDLARYVEARRKAGKRR